MRRAWLSLSVGTVLLAACLQQPPPEGTAPATLAAIPTLTPMSAEGEWTVYTITDAIQNDEDSLPDQWINEIAVAGDGTVWVDTREAMAYFDGGHLAHTP